MNGTKKPVKARLLADADIQAALAASVAEAERLELVELQLADELDPQGAARALLEMIRKTPSPAEREALRQRLTHVQGPAAEASRGAAQDQIIHVYRSFADALVRLCDLAIEKVRGYVIEAEADERELFSAWGLEAVRTPASANCRQVLSTLIEVRNDQAGWMSRIAPSRGIIPRGANNSALAFFQR